MTSTMPGYFAKRAMVLLLRVLGSLPMSGEVGFDRCGEVLDSCHHRPRILHSKNLIAKQRHHVEPLEGRALQARVVEVVAVDVDCCLAHGSKLKKPPEGGFFALSKSQPNDTTKGL